MIGITTSSSDRPVGGNEQPVIRATDDGHKKGCHGIVVLNSIKQLAKEGDVSTLNGFIDLLEGSVADIDWG